MSMRVVRLHGHQGCSTCLAVTRYRPNQRTATEQEHKHLHQNVSFTGPRRAHS